MMQPDSYGTLEQQRGSETLSLSRNVAIENMTDKSIRAILYASDDKLQWIPLGGVAGPGVKLIKPMQTAQLEMPMNHDSACLKIFNPLIIDCLLDSFNVIPGQFVQYAGQESTKRANIATATVGAGVVGLVAGSILLGPLIGIGAAAGAVWAATRDDDMGAIAQSVGGTVSRSTLVAKDAAATALNSESGQHVVEKVNGFFTRVASTASSHMSN